MDNCIRVDEVWKDICEYEGLYEVSNKGRIKSSARYIYHKHSGFGRMVRERIIKQRFNRWGYCIVNLSKSGKATTFQVHRLVVNSFFGVNNSDLQVNHINGDKTNNELDNLELVTSEENIKHGYKEKLIVNVSKRMTKEIAEEIRGRYLGSVTQNDLSEEYGFSIRSISKVINKKTW